MKKPLIVLIVALGLMRPAWADFQDGLAAYERGDYATALREFRSLAEQGDAAAQYNLALMYATGHGVPLDVAAARRWYRRAAEQGHSKAQYHLALSYDYGQGEQQDYAAAARWYRKAAEQGNAKAQHSLGFMYEQGRGVPQNYAEAVKWYRKAADQGNAEHQLSLGLMYAFGTGVPQDGVEAVRWIGKAASQGTGFGMARMGLNAIYLSDSADPETYAELAKWYRGQANQGDAEAQNRLGEMYYYGKGLPQDYATAVLWYRRAGNQGNSYAQLMLGYMYAAGVGVAQDYVLAHMWLNLGIARLEPGEVRDDAARARAAETVRMTPAQVAEAQRLARAWSPKPETLTVEQFEKRYPGQPAPAPQPRAAHTDPKQQALVARVQQGLTSLGYDPGPNDGIVGPKTRAAIRAFQADHDLAVTGEVSVKLELALLKQSLLGPKKARLEKDSTGSGFAVSGEGHILTNHHVVEDCEEVRLPTGAAVQVIAGDAQSDLALLEGPVTDSKFATFSQGRGVRPGDAIVVVGFPLHGLLTSDPSVTTGNVSALAGPGDDRRFLQITAPVQQGNSGGPLLDLAGNVVGVVVAKLDAIKVANLTGDIPQNVNFAVSAWSARAFLDAYNVPYETAPSEPKLAARDVAAQAREFTVLVECWK